MDPNEELYYIRQKKKKELYYKIQHILRAILQIPSKENCTKGQQSIIWVILL
jgi:hypothetical protein